MKTMKPTLRLHAWLEIPEGQIIGLGRAMLLEEIRLNGSLNKAATALGMSYRAAWGRLKKTEEMLGEALVVRGEGRKGFELTPRGLELAAAFRRFYASVEAYALEAARKEFPWDIQPFVEPAHDRDPA